MNWLSKFSRFAYAIIRIVAGVMFAMHGSQKLFGLPGGKPPVHLFSMMGAAGTIELVAGVLIAVGFLTCCAAFVASGEMAFAYFLAHFHRGFLPIINQGELAVLYCFLFLYIACAGSGTLSVDELRKSKR